MRLSTEPTLWKAALDALVKINHPRCLAVLAEAKAAAQREKLAWVEEAIAQLIASSGA